MLHTRALLVAVLLVGVADGLVHVSSDRGVAGALPAVQGFDPQDVDRITIGRVDVPVVLSRGAGGWELVAPVSAPADPASVSDLLDGLKDGVRPEARVDDGDLERYGLDGGEERRVDVLQGDRTVLALYVGHDAGGGASWVRFPGDDAVYRARVGGRGRFDRSPGAWRDRQVTDLDPASILRITVGPTVLTRADEGWRSASGPVDAQVVDALVRALAKLRGLEVAAPGRGTDTAPLRVGLDLADSDPVELVFGRVGELWHVRRGEDRWRVDPELPALLAGAPASLADRALWSVPVAEVRALEVVGEARQGRIEVGPDGWRVVRPANVDVDPRRAAAAAEWLATPRVEGWVDGPTTSLGFPSAHQWRVTTGQRQRTIELGSPSADRRRVPVRDPSVPDRIGWIDARIVDGIEAIFGG